MNAVEERTPWTRVGTLAAQVLAETQIRTEHPDLRGLSTGLPSVDEKLGDALEPGRLIVLVGESGRGKSVMAAQLSVAFAHQTPVLWCSLEDGGVDATRRALANVARTPVSALRSGYRTGSIPAAAFEAQRTLDELPLDMLETAGDVTTLAWIIRQWWRSEERPEGLPGVVVVDQLSHIFPTPPNAERDERLGALGFPIPPGPGATQTEKLEWQVNLLREVAVKLGIVIVLLHQLNGKREEGNKRPTMESVRGSQGVVHKADLLLCVWRPSRIQDPWAPPGQPSTIDAPEDRAELIALKGRAIGADWSLKLRFDGAHQRFAEPDEAFDSTYSAPTAPSASALEGAQRLANLRRRFAATGQAELPAATPAVGRTVDPAEEPF